MDENPNGCSSLKASGLVMTSRYELCNHFDTNANFDLNFVEVGTAVTSILVTFSIII